MVKSEFGSSMGSKEPEHFRKIFIGGLSYSTTDETLQKHFEQWGEIVDVVVMKDSRTKRSRGFGFITYSESHMVDEAQLARPHNIDGREVETKRAVPRNDIGRPEAGANVKKIFVGGLKEEIEEDDLRDYFSEFGSISKISLITNRDTGKRRGFGFVEFDDYDSVDKICLRSTHTIHGKKIDVKRAVGKEMMRLGGGGGGGMSERRRGGDMGDRGMGGRSGGGSDRGWGDRGSSMGGGGGGWGERGSGSSGGGGWSDRGSSSGGGWGSSGGGWSGGRSSGGGGGGSWDNGSSTQPWGSGGGSPWDSQGSSSGGGGGGGGGGSWSSSAWDSGGSGSGYQQGYSGGPMRSSSSSYSRSAPYSSGASSGGYGGGGGSRRY